MVPSLPPSILRRRPERHQHSLGNGGDSGMDIGVFIPIGNNGWLISTTSPQYMPTFELNKQIARRPSATASTSRSR